MQIPARTLLMLGGLALAASPSAGQQPVAPVGWRALSAGSDHTCGLTTDGRVFCWGANEYGQLGDGTRNSRWIPAPVAARAGLRFQSVAAGDENSCAVSTDGSAWCWGDNRNANVGDRTHVTRLAPARVAGRVPFRSVSFHDRPCALGESGETYCWGGYTVTAPVAVPRRSRSEHGAFGARSCDLTADSTVVCWNWDDSSASVRPLPGGLRFARIFLRGNTACGVTAAGSAHCWGWFVPGRPENPVGESGAWEPFHVAPELRFRSMQVLWQTACGLTLDGVPYCWGEPSPLVPGVPERQATPVPVRIAVERPLVSLTFGRMHACGLTADGAAYCWGLNSSGQLGDGTDAARAGAVRVAEPAAPGATDIPGPAVLLRPTASQWIRPQGFDSTRIYPVIVYFPPLLGSEQRPMGRYTAAVADYVVMIPRDTVWRDEYSDTEDFSEVLPRYERGVLADLAAFAAVHRLDTSRVVLAGFGGGGDLAWTISQRNPTRFSGAIVMGSTAGYRAPAANLPVLARRGARYFFVLGDGELPARLRGVRSAMALLQRNGIQHRLGSVPESDHVPAPAAMFAEALAFVLGPRGP